MKNRRLAGRRRRKLVGQQGFCENRLRNLRKEASSSGAKFLANFDLSRRFASGGEKKVERLFEPGAERRRVKIEKRQKINRRQNRVAK